MNKTPDMEEQVAQAGQIVNRVLDGVETVIMGQRPLLKSLVIGLLCEGHLLIEGAPGLGKSLTVQTLAQCLDAAYQRIQFTPDLLPADLLGTEVFSPKDGEFHLKKGPIFANIILADEINRAPPKVQSALLEAMQERQVTLGKTTIKLDEPFLVLATQNPIEHEGTYPLPEAQKDRFFMKLNIEHPARADEIRIVEAMARTKIRPSADKVMETKELLELQDLVNGIYADEKIVRYAIDIVFATRDLSSAGLKEYEGLIQYGASTRASIALILAARASALIHGRTYVTPKDIKDVGLNVLRHRVHMSYEAEAENIGSDWMINRIFDAIEVP